MKEFKITAIVFPSCRMVFGVELADNVRDAWRNFKKSNKQYNRLLFQSAKTSERSYYKIN